ncbi:restriction endonuclease subunit S [Streptomyces sp. NPDC096105]|uniref:restriction endonuclease subunit S n=1 Tax=Streptomyces sp. NPDC096105 TaxID=3366074 RepID=UPI0037F85DCA
MADLLFVDAPVEWRRTNLAVACSDGGGIQTGPFGSQLHASDYVADGIPSVMPQDIGENVIRDGEIARITIEDARRLSKYRLRKGDIVYSRRGDVTRRALVRDAQEGWLCGTGCLRVRPGAGVDSLFLSYFLGHPEVRTWIIRHAVGATMPNLNTQILGAVPVLLPELDEQRRVAAVLGALDDRIAVNERIATTSRELGLAIFAQAVAEDGGMEVDIDSVSCVLTRGIAPKYSESPDDLVVLNQKCIRGGRVSLTPARRTLRDKVKEPKLLVRNDVLVNSTGVGTLGRVACWNSDEAATVDSHITIVRFDETQLDPVCAGFAMLRAQPEIEAMGEGSTGQTELRRTQLGELEISLPSKEKQHELRPKLDSLEARADQALSESQTLATLRDTLLPQLMSGRLRVKDAEKIVEDAT